MVYDRDFLLELDRDKNKTIYARITALRFDESPIEFIEGRVTQGSVNIDGTSAIRRSCSLTMVAAEFDYRNYYWGLNTKFKLEIGLENYINPAYPKVCWFDQGIFLITQFNTNRNASSFNISISGKDKMCQLNGEIGGNFESSVDFGQIEEQNPDGSWKITKLPIHRIIREMVHQYAGEPFHNIIINDLEEYGLELLEYQYDVPMFLYRHIDSPIYTNALLKGEVDCKVDRLNTETGDIERVSIQVKDLTNTELEMLVDPLTGTPDPAKVWIWDSEEKEDVPYYFAKIETNQTAGYRTAELTYAGDLIAAAGDTVTSVLDKIVNMLGEFEYFYDLQGQFVFQKKRSFINTLQSPLVDSSSDDGDGTYNEQYVESLAIASSQSYVFHEGELITAFNNNPNLTNMKNDYSIWGTRTSTKGTEVPIHMRYAIDKKPTFYRTYDGTKFYSTEKKTDEELYDEIFKEIYGEFVKKPNPNGLPEDWWDIMDWAERYKMLKGFYPPGHIGQYCKESVARDIPLNDYFPAPADDPSPNDYFGTWKQHGRIYIFDVEADGTLGYFGHMSYCSHYYNYFLERAQQGLGTSYIYKPVIPESEGGDVSTIVTDIMKNRIYNQDWREIIYQMALDYYKHGQEEDFEQRIIENNYPYYPTGLTGYESYYIDLQGFWRQLYYPIERTVQECQDEKAKLLKDKKFIDNFVYTIDYIEENKDTLSNLDKKFDQFFYVGREKDAEGVWHELNQFGDEKHNDETDNEYEERMGELLLQFKDALYVTLIEIEELIAKCDTKIEEVGEESSYYYSKNELYPYWRKDVYESPQSLNFWFDFLDTDGELAQFNVQNVGRRPKVVNDSSVKSIYFRDTPDIIFRTADEGEIMTGYRYIQAPMIETMFKISAQGKSAKDKLDELIYTHGYCVESATITTIPIYYLEPNIRVHLYDNETNLCGDYIISKYTIPLAYNGTMSITATKAAENIV